MYQSYIWCVCTSVCVYALSNKLFKTVLDDRKITKIVLKVLIYPAPSFYCY